MSIDQARKSLLSRSLVQITAQQQKSFLELATMREKRRELDVMESRSAQTIAEDDLQSSLVPDRPNHQPSD
ncbi:hypothetical protein [Nitrobacter vulgaris]|uniref:Uncharacterized protein n=1 Tax=Nitrobacter vulgaris TaxID=29421 RepID=A0A1V4I129_NITVU|nr:hypothetical protein [Nitrobacter vulgaris]OPH83844.1 hypothetical protein B2M20_04875 [Nitrobacter vulgaris]